MRAAGRIWVSWVGWAVARRELCTIANAPCGTEVGRSAWVGGWAPWVMHIFPFRIFRAVSSHYSKKRFITTKTPRRERLKIAFVAAMGA